MMIVMVSVIGVAVTGSSFAGVDPRREALGYHPLIQVVLMGVAGAFLTGDVFNLYVWFEVMLIGSFVLMSLHRTWAQLHAAFTYVGLNLLASAFLLTAIGLLYGQAGTLNLADLARAWPERRTPGLDAALFYDAGKVALRREDLNFRNLEHDYGFGFRFNTDNGTILRIDAGFGSQDGKHLYIVFGDVF